MLQKFLFITVLLTLCLLVPNSVHSQEYEYSGDDSVGASMELSLQPADKVAPANTATSPEDNNFSPKSTAPSPEDNNFTPTNNAEFTSETTEMTNNFDVPRPQLQTIKTLDDNCIKYLCHNFHYNRLDQVAFFDIKAEVRINSDDATYDIVNARNSDSLIFENSTFARFPLHLFYAISTRLLDMRNCSIQVVTWECFLMAHDLQVLKLSNNNLEVIKAATFKFASDLRELFLDSNRLTQLHRDSFEDLGTLRYLDLRQNRLTQLPNGVFDQLPALQELLLDNNRLRTISNQHFPKNLNLMLLSLGDNRLQHIDEHAFRRQARLFILYIANNKQLRTLVMTLQLQFLVASNCALTRVNIYGQVHKVDLSCNRILELYFAQPEQLELLNLRNNSLQQIASLTLATKLQLLDLGDNPELHELPTPWLANSLERLDLGNTGLRQLPVEAIAEQKQLNFLNVSYNLLREINPLNFKYLEHLSHFDIRGNDWNCYNLNTLMDVLIQPRNIICGYDKFDPDYPGQYINDIACMYRLEEEADSDISSSQQVGALTGNKLGQLGQLQAGPQEELVTFRRELKAIVGIFEQKFDQAFRKIDELNARLQAFERLNETLFRHATITV